MTSSRAVHEPLLRRQQFLALLVAAVLCATLLIAYLLWSARQDALRAAQVTALNYARTLEVRLDATFRRTDSILHGLAQVTPVEAMAAQGEQRFAARLNGELDSMLREFDEMIALRLIDARGEQRYVSSAATTPGANYADRSFFATYRTDPHADLLFSEVVTGRVSQRPTMVITRPLRDPQGRFYGAVLAPLDLSFFQQQFAGLDIGRNGAVFLRRTDADGRLVLRWPQIDAEVNKPMPLSHPIWLAVQGGKQESLNEYVAFTDGVQRISGTVVVKGYPFFLTVALSADDVLAGWRRLALLTGLSWAALLALMSALMWRLWRIDRERRSLEAQLRESQRIESIGTLAGGIAHDFNNILAGILGNVALAREDVGAGHPAQKSLEQIRKASTRARDLVQQILAFGRRQPHALVNQPLQPLVAEAMALLRSTLPASVALECAMVNEPLHAMADATQIQQVLMNLCTNAWHALQGRPGRVLVALEPFDVDAQTTRTGTDLLAGRYAHLWVQDTGSGMDAATRARIFEPFFTTKPMGQGTGLGLSVVHGIVAAHHGAIRVDSAPGEGTTVHLYLPATDPEPVSPPPPGTEPGALQGTGQHVLYIDDDDVIVLMVERLLVQAGYRVTLFTDGREAVAAVLAEPLAFDLVVSDFNMPGFTGMDVARAVAVIRPDLPVVISSGYISEDLQMQANAAGVRSLIQKQNTLEDLARVVRGILAS
jgi:signal transduction histidine kinase/CheY-like chemotaxis protein